MSEDLSFSQELIEQAKSSDVEKSKKKRFLIRFIIAGGLTVVIVLAFLLNIGGWFTLTNFSKDVPLTQNISRWDSLAWGATGNFTTDNINTATGDWLLNTKTGEFTSQKYIGCTMYFNKTTGDYGTTGHDLEDTQSYTKTFFSDKELKTTTTWVPLTGFNTKGVQVLKTMWVDEANNTAISYYRHSPLNKTLVFGTIRCADANMLEKIAPWSNTENELTNVGVWLKK